MDKQKIREQLTKLESKTEPWLDRQFTKLVASRWTSRIAAVFILVLLIVVVLL